MVKDKITPFSQQVASLRRQGHNYTQVHRWLQDQGVSVSFVAVTQFCKKLEHKPENDMAARVTKHVMRDVRDKLNDMALLEAMQEYWLNILKAAFEKISQDESYAANFKINSMHDILRIHSILLQIDRAKLTRQITSQDSDATDFTIQWEPQAFEIGQHKKKDIDNKSIQQR